MLPTVESLDILNDVVISFGLPIQVPDQRCGSITIAEDTVLEGQEMFSLYVSDISPLFPPGSLDRDFPIRPPEANATLTVASDGMYYNFL